MNGAQGLRGSGGSFDGLFEFGGGAYGGVYAAGDEALAELEGGELDELGEKNAEEDAGDGGGEGLPGRGEGGWEVAG